MSEINKESEYIKYYVYICEHTLLREYRENHFFSVKYNHTKGKAGAGMWKKK